MKSGLNFLKGVENRNSYVFIRHHERFLFTMEVINRAVRNSEEIKGHYLNITAAIQEDSYERARLASELGSIILVTGLVIG